MSIRPNGVFSRRRFLLLLMTATATACGRSATPTAPPLAATPTASDASAGGGGILTPLGPLTLDRRIVSRGETIVGKVTYANETTLAVAVSNIVIVARPFSGQANDAGPAFSPGFGAAIVLPGQRITLVATCTLTDAASGDWSVSSRYQDAAGAWHDASSDAAVTFAVSWPGPPARNATAASATPGSAITSTPTPVTVQMLERITPLYWGAYIDGVPWDLARLDAFEGWAGKRSSLVHWGQPWWRDGQYQPFYPTDFDRVRGHGALPLLDWGSWDYTVGPDQPAFSLAAIARGDHDTHIRAWATSARDWGHPFFLRFNWEMNGWWQFPWAERLNGNRPGDYAAAWRHVHDLFAQVGATNATWVWCPNVVSSQTTPLAGLYPGDGYVDWVAMDGYNWGNDYGNVWQSFAEVFGPTYSALRQLAPTKPIMIAEVGCQERGGDKAAWIRDALGVQLPARFPAIKALGWFNWNDGDPIQTGIIESSAAAISAFSAVVSNSSVYLPNKFADFNVSPIPPLDIVRLTGSGRCAGAQRRGESWEACCSGPRRGAGDRPPGGEAFGAGFAVDGRG